MAIRFCLPDATLEHLIERLTVADINATMTGVTYNGVTPLQLALRHVSSLKSIECLLDNGADVNACDKDGWSIVKEAVWRHPEALPRILAQGSLSRTGVLRKVLKLRLGCNAKCCNDKPDISGSIAKLLDHGFDLDPEDAEDVGVLLDAVRAGNIELVLRLLRWGASLTDECNGHDGTAYGGRAR
ncbi:unnamed protein product [Bemisia tabaci]|uniref:Ankyrin n=1 Tax=Bemisia tabaci TaxID=7038 RepID=A0A9P0AIV3_BEMTA|nr:unnamed protein product [Bemisia tabaci]